MIKEINILAQNIWTIVGNSDSKRHTFRPDAEKVFKHLLESYLIPQNNLTRIYFDFADVEATDVSYVDEVLINTILYLRKQSLDIQLVIRNINEVIRENIVAAAMLRTKKEKINNNKIQIQFLEELDKKLIILGELEDNLISTFNYLVKNKSLTARELSDLTNLPINTSSNKLKRLYDYNIIFRVKESDEDGQYYKYYL